MGNRDAFKAVLSPEDGKDVIPAFFSYAKYKGNERQYYKGVYAYPSKLTPDLEQKFASGELCHFSSGGYIHYVNTVGEQEYIVISRINHGDLRNTLAIIVVAMMLYFILSFFPKRGKREQTHEKHYFKTVVSIVLMVSLSITMATLAVVSVTFVYNRNEINSRRMMSDKANSIRNMLQSSLRNQFQTGRILFHITADKQLIAWPIHIPGQQQTKHQHHNDRILLFHIIPPFWS